MLGDADTEAFDDDASADGEGESKCEEERAGSGYDCDDAAKYKESCVVAGEAIVRGGSGSNIIVKNQDDEEC